jgi:inner membrane protein
MDSLTQAVLGAGIQGAMLGRYQGRRALLYGALLATLPDLDVVIRYADPVSAMTHHRGFSHSLLVLPPVAALIAWLIRQWKPHPGYGYGRLFLTLLLVLVTHPLLDAFTSYGTQLWWPFMPTPAVWSSVFIIDPAYTIPLLMSVALAVAWGREPRAQRALRWGLALSTAYLAFTLVGKSVHETRAVDALRDQGVEVQEVFSTPAPLNSLLWRVVARDGQGHYYEVMSSWFDRQPPESVRLPLGEALLPALASSPEHERLRWFSGGWLRYDVVDNKLVVTDLRMGVAGYYSFRFVMAHREDDGAWQAIQPYSLQGSRGGWPQLQLLFRRIVSQQPPVPMADWDANMRLQGG